MAKFSAHQPLLSDGAVEHGYAKRMPFWPSLVKWVLKTLMWAVFLAWVAAIFLYPSETVHALYTKFNQATEGSVFGITGSVFLLFSAPVLVLAFLAYTYVTAFPGDEYETKTKRTPRMRLWTFPVLVDGPFGVVSAAEFIGILLFSAYIIWAVYCYALEAESLVSKFSLPSNLRRYLLLEIYGLRLGTIGLFCLALLFLPIARGSILLRLIDIPFEHATKYHVWLGHLTMAIFTLHGICYVISWAQQGRLLSELLAWSDIGVANLPGVISLLAGLLMWVTSLQTVRKNYFELFFYTHQLYVVFIIFLAMHVGDFIFSIAAGGIFLFVVDRFLRFCQSRTTVNVVSAACLPCGTLELVLSKPPNLRYNALSFIFLQVRELSWLQWHPFSVSSSPLDGKNHISILIKVLGKWTGKLRDVITNIAEKPQKNIFSQPGKLTASVEGPYGHEVAYHLMYENLILVAGGIGISPFLAILSDVLHRIEERRPCLPKNILVVWAVKKSKELSLLSVVDAQSICPSLSNNLHLEIQAYVTQESEPPLEEGKDYENSSSFTMTNGSNISSLVGTGDNAWVGAYFAISTFGFFVLLGLSEVFYIRPYGISSWWLQGLIFTICMVASVVIFGGLIVFLWNLCEKRNSSDNICSDNNEKTKPVQQNAPMIHSDTKTLLSSMTTRYGCRPDFEAIFDNFSDHEGRVDVGVIVCGPPGLQSSVALVCRSKNIKGRWNQPIFHFNSHSFDL